MARIASSSGSRGRSAQRWPSWPARTNRVRQPTSAPHRVAGGEAYNLGTGVETSGNDVAAAVVELTGLDAAKVSRVVDRAGHDYRYALDVSKARDDLGWSAEVGFREGMEQTVDWYRENERWWRPLRNGEYWEFYKRNYKSMEIS